MLRAWEVESSTQIDRRPQTRANAAERYFAMREPGQVEKTTTAGIFEPNARFSL
jgi:hypothetical protein